MPQAKIYKRKQSNKKILSKRENLFQIKIAKILFN